MGVGSALFVTAMIEVDESELTADDHEFLKRWSEALGVSVAVLIGQILSAAIEGDQQTWADEAGP